MSDQLCCTMFNLFAAYLYRFGQINMSVCLSVCMSACLHIDHGNNHTSYQLGGTEVPTATQEKYAGVIVAENLNVSTFEQCAKVQILQIKG